MNFGCIFTKANGDKGLFTSDGTSARSRLVVSPFAYADSTLIFPVTLPSFYNPVATEIRHDVSFYFGENLGAFQLPSAAVPIGYPAPYAGKIIVAGGNPYQNGGKSCQMYDPETATWSAFPVDLNNGRTSIPYLVWSEQGLLCIGGGSDVTEMLVFNDPDWSWTEVETVTDSGTTPFACSTPNGWAYLIGQMLKFRSFHVGSIGDVNVSSVMPGTLDYVCAIGLNSGYTYFFAHTTGDGNSSYLFKAIVGGAPTVVATGEDSSFYIYSMTQIGTDMLHMVTNGEAVNSRLFDLITDTFGTDRFQIMTSSPIIAGPIQLVGRILRDTDAPTFAIIDDGSGHNGGFRFDFVPA